VGGGGRQHGSLASHPRYSVVSLKRMVARRRESVKWLNT
jgi:hypothetical protein